MPEQPYIPMVSLITPCYNCSAYLPRLLESVLAQNYPRLEHVFIDDGSTDNTHKVIESYRSQYEAKGISMVCRQQENQGPGGAVNHGLKLFTGEFVSMPDSDDFFYPNAISKAVQYFQLNPECGILQINNDLFWENDLQRPVGTTFQRRKYDNINDKSALLEGYLLEKYQVMASTGLMFRASAFLSINPKREIYPSRSGQNWQVMLPLIYFTELGLLEEVQGAILIRHNSHSHALPTTQDRIQRGIEHEKILQETLNSMCLPADRDLHFRRLLAIKYHRIRAKLYAKIGAWQKMRQNLSALKKLSASQFTDYGAYLYFLRSLVYKK